MDTKVAKQKLKSEIKVTVEKKVGLTRMRCEFKVSSRGVVAEDDRLARFREIDSDRWSTKYKIRHLLLAYAHVRRMPYKRVEAKCDETPNADYIVSHAAEYGVELSLDEVQTWLAVPAFSPFGRDPRGVELSESDAQLLSGVPEPLKVLVPVTIGK